MANRVLVIGLDGATFDVMGPWLERNKLPYLEMLMREGTYGVLRTIIPPNSCSAWSSFATGKNPGRHGIFEFVVMKNENYDITPTNASFRASKDLWEVLSEHGKRVIVLNVPFTYPVRKVNGVLVSGEFKPDGASNATYPPSFKEEFNSIVPDYDATVLEMVREGWEEDFLKNLYDSTENVRRLALHMIENHLWDFFIVVFTGSDVIQHGLWSYVFPSHPRYTEKKREKYGDSMLKFFQKLDSYIGELIEKVDENTTILIMSDHGHQPLAKWVHMSSFLMKKGMLTLKWNLKRLMFRLGITTINVYKILFNLGLGRLKRSISTEKARSLFSIFFTTNTDVDWSRTKAYCLPGTGQVYINLKGREPQGIVEPGEEYEEIRDRLIEDLKVFEDPNTDKRVFEEVRKREEIWQGPFLERMPDIQLLPVPNYGVFATHEFGSPSLITDSFGIDSSHSMEGMFVLKGPAIRKDLRLQGAEIIDLAPSILFLMELGVPTDMDGKVLIGAIKPDYLESHPVAYRKVAEEYSEPIYPYSNEDEEKVKERLRKLGYLE